MLTYSDKLLEQSLQKYWSTTDCHFEFSVANGDELARCVEACLYLCERGFISNVSDNMLGGSINITFDPVIYFDITDAGVEYIVKKLKTQK